MNILSKCQLPSSYGLGYTVSWGFWMKGWLNQWINEWMNWWWRCFKNSPGYTGSVNKLKSPDLQKLVSLNVTLALFQIIVGNSEKMHYHFKSYGIVKGDLPIMWLCSLVWILKENIARSQKAALRNLINFYHNLSFWVLSQFEFLSFVTNWNF